MRVQVLKLLLQVDCQVLSQFGTVAYLGLIALILLPVCQIMAHMSRFVGWNLCLEARLVEEA